MRSIAVQDIDNYIGQELGVSDWLPIDQARINDFAKATGDLQWIHIDVERANRERGGTIAHGYLVLSLIPVLHESITEITGIALGLNYGLNRVRFTGMVKAGTSIRLRERLIATSAKREGILATYEFMVEQQGSDKPVLIAEALGLLVPAT